MKNIFRISGVILLIFLIHSCKKDKLTLPILTTTDVSAITQTTATSGGNITNDGGVTVLSRGVCWSTNNTPTIADNKTLEGAGAGSFVSAITGLTSNTTYFVRAYATNSAGTGYGNELSVILWMNVPGPSVTDVDGNSYNSVKIGNQIWMAENLKTTKYRNGDLIGTTTPTTLDIGTEGAPKYQWAYEGNESNVATYGRLYTWYAVTDSRNLCPTGWYVPTDAEWLTLITYLGGEHVTGNKLKETGTTHWQSPNTGATNETGFTALPGGIRDLNGVFLSIGVVGYWWSATEGGAAHAWPYLNYSTSNVYGHGYYLRNGFSVRCVKD